MHAWARDWTSAACIAVACVGCSTGGASTSSDHTDTTFAAQPGTTASGTGAANPAETDAPNTPGASADGPLSPAAQQAQPETGTAGPTDDGAQPAAGGAAGASAGTASDGMPSADGLSAQQTPPDPDITFDWTETQPGATDDGSCKPGSYAGSFTCDALLVADDPSSAIEVTGPVVFTLTKSQNGEFLEISDGHLDGYAQLFINFTAELSGKLDCSSNSFDAVALNGVYGFGDVNALPAGTFEGTLSGTLDGPSLTLNGNWILTGDSTISCEGPWTATFTP